MMKKALLLSIAAISVLASCSKKIYHSIEKQAELEEETAATIEEYHEERSYEKFSFPLPKKYRYYISSKQGMRGSIEDVNAGGTASAAIYHNAIDFAVPVGTPVYAAKDGYVVNCYPSLWNGSQWKGHPTYGGMIELKHADGTSSLYAHLVQTTVKEGTFVQRGDQIGLTGGKKGKRGSGNSTGPHLHFSVFVDIETMLID